MARHSSKFVWHDLMTSDVAAAKKFYGALLGWTFENNEHGPYEHVMSGGKMIGGMMKWDQSPPSWLGYVSVESVDDVVSSATKLGGKVYSPARDIPNTGRFAVLADPQGGVFAPFKDAGMHPEEPETNARPAVGTFCWDELTTRDPAAAAKFYSTLFGWGTQTVPMAGFGNYTLLKRTGVKDEMGEDKNAGGIMQLPPNAPYPPFWMHYIAVADADATARRLRELGGKVMMDPMDIPDVGKFFPAMDPQGATVAFLAAQK